MRITRLEPMVFGRWAVEAITRNGCRSPSRHPLPCLRIPAFADGEAGLRMRAWRRTGAVQHDRFHSRRPPAASTGCPPSDYPIPTSCSPITSCCNVGKEKAMGLPGLWSGRRDLNPRRSPWQGEHRPRHFNELAGLAGAKSSARLPHSYLMPEAISSCAWFRCRTGVTLPLETENANNEEADQHHG